MENRPTQAGQSRVRAGARVLWQFGSLQMVSQALAFVAALAAVRLMPKEEFALYTLALTILGTMNVLADAGVTNGVLALGGRVWQDKRKLAQVIGAGSVARRPFALLTLVVAFPVTVFLLQRHGASTGDTVAVALLVGATFVVTLQTLLRFVPLRLHQRAWDVQGSEMVGNGVRALTLVLVLAVLPVAWSGMVCVLAGGWVVFVWGSRRSGELLEQSVGRDERLEGELRSTTRRVLPNIVYYCLSGQIAVWLLSVRGTTEGLADIGALSRLGQVMMVATALVGTVITPRFARMSDRRETVQLAAWSVASFLLFGAAVSAAAWFVPAPFLWLIGERYADLETELVLVLVAMSSQAIVGLVYSLLIARNWLVSPWPVIGFSILALAGGIWMLDVSTVRGVIILSMVTAPVSLGIYGWRLIRELRALVVATDAVGVTPLAER